MKYVTWYLLSQILLISCDVFNGLHLIYGFTQFTIYTFFETHSAIFNFKLSWSKLTPYPCILRKIYEINITKKVRYAKDTQKAFLVPAIAYEKPESKTLEKGQYHACKFYDKHQPEFCGSKSDRRTTSELHSKESTEMICPYNIKYKFYNPR